MLPTLSFGSYGETVRLLQGALNAWPKSKQPPLSVDGAFGPKTNNKVREFQGGSNLAADGVVGPLTWAQLEPLIKAIKAAYPIPGDEAAAGERIAAGAEAAHLALGWTRNDVYSPANQHIAAAKCADSNSPGRPRQGAMALAQIFAIAEVPGAFQSRIPRISQEAVGKWQQQTVEGTVWRNGNDLCAWCGIFTVYILRSVGFTIPGGWGSQKQYVKEAQDAFNKKTGDGSVYRLFTDPKQAFRGCIGVVKPTTSNHHFIVTDNKDGVVSSIDGNFSGFGIDPDPKMHWDCKSIIGRTTYTHQTLRDGAAYFLFPAASNR